MVAAHPLGVIGPALRGEGPELRAEPGVEHVLVLPHVVSTTVGAGVNILHKGVLPAAVLAVKHRDAVTPPELPRDTPVLEAIHPSEVSIRPTCGMKRDLTVAHDLGRAFLEPVHRHEPLLREPRLERRVAAVTVHDGVIEFLDPLEEAVLLEPGDDSLAALVTAHAGELTITVHDVSAFVKDIDLG